MSSVVNKSQKRFMPKMGARGPGGRPTQGRLSGLKSNYGPTPPSSQPRPVSSEHIPLPAKPAQSAAPNVENTLTQPINTQLGSQANLINDPANNTQSTQVQVQQGSMQVPTQVHSEGSMQVPVPIPVPAQVQSQLPAQVSMQVPTQLSSQGYSQRSTQSTSQLHSQGLSQGTVQSPSHVNTMHANNEQSIKPSPLNSQDVYGKFNSSQPSSRPSSYDLKYNLSLLNSPTETLNEPEHVAALTPNPSVKPKPKPKPKPVHRPEAPPGFQYVIPEDIPRLRALERKRKAEFEKKLTAEMRRLMCAKEKQRLIDSKECTEEEAEIRAQVSTETMTFRQLKQAVGSEVKDIRDNKEEASDSKQIIDVEQFTMGSLCKDIPVGDKNESYDDYELARINRRRDTLRVFRAKMWSRRMYTPKVEEQASLREAYKKYRGERQSRSGKIKEEQLMKMSELDNQSESGGSLPQAAIEIQANGNISLVGTQYDRHQNNMSLLGTSSKAKTEVDPTEQVINSHSFTTKERPDRWSKEETEKFYDALSAWGTDFNLISHLFPLRSRNQIKTKFKYEEKRNAVKVQMHLLTRRRVNVDSYAKVSDVDIKEINSIESEIESVRKEHHDQMKLGEFAKQRAKLEDDQRNIENMRHKGDTI